MPHADPMIIETAQKLFSSLSTPEVIEAAEAGHWPAELWDTLAETALDRTWISEEYAGVGATPADGFAVIRKAGELAVPVPIADTLVANWLLAGAGIEPPPGPTAVAPTQSQTRLDMNNEGLVSGRAPRISFANRAEHVVLCAQHPDGLAIALVRREACQLENHNSLAGESLDTLVCNGVTPEAFGLAPGQMGDNPVLLLGAAARSQQMAGALAGALEISLQYCQDRIAFGRPISKFQAVQHNLAQLASEAAAAGVAADGAASAIERYGLTDSRTHFAVAAGKIRSGEAAGEGAAIAHQVHGAIGFTKEYRLHHLTRRLWAWRDDFDPETVWATRLGEQVCADGIEALWPTITQI